jgi:hypothetical protein
MSVMAPDTEGTGGNSRSAVELSPSVTIYLEAEAYAVALAEESPGRRVLLHPHARAAIERAPVNAAVFGIYDVLCGEAEAWELADYFTVCATFLRVAGDSRWEVCERARLAVEYALNRR